MHDIVMIKLKFFNSNISPDLYTVSSLSPYFCYQKIIYENGEFMFFVAMKTV